MLRTTALLTAAVLGAALTAFGLWALWAGRSDADRPTLRLAVLEIAVLTMLATYAAANLDL